MPPRQGAAATFVARHVTRGAPNVAQVGVDCCRSSGLAGRIGNKGALDGPQGRLFRSSRARITLSTLREAPIRMSILGMLDSETKG